MIEDQDLMEDKELNEKMCINALMTERLVRLSSDEKKKVVRHLLDVCDMSEREIAKRLGVPHTTLNGWKTGKIKDKTGQYLSLDVIIKRLETFEPKSQEEFLKIRKISEIVSLILQ